jgi:hypothetical protein
MTDHTWFTDRPPTAEDGDSDGDVCMEPRPGSRHNPPCVHWSYVGPGVPWRRTVFWTAPANLPGVNGQWIKGTDALPSRCHADSDGEVQVLVAGDLQWIQWRTVGSVTRSAIWRPAPQKDTRPITAAEPARRLPGRKEGPISGCDVLPTFADADADGDVQVRARGFWIFRKWDCVERSNEWRPVPSKDPRPSRSCSC